MHQLLQRLDRSASIPSPQLLQVRLPGRLLYAVSHCYPFSSNGYAVRTHGVASALVSLGLHVITASRPGMPWDLQGKKTKECSCSHNINGVRYLHRPTPSTHEGTLENYLTNCVDAWTELIQVFKPEAMMAASNWQTALPAAIAAHEAGIPFFYEVRGFWELSRAAYEPQWLGTPEYQREVTRETRIARYADKVFTLNRFMREELISRGIDASRVELVPNGVQRQQSMHTQTPSRQSEGIKARYVVGYIGSFNIYEGLELLVHALALLRQRGIDIALLLVGSSESTGLGSGEDYACPATQRYRKLAQELGVADYLFMPGRVSTELAMAYYALLDVVVISRTPLPVCELVSPMKAMEAAAYGKLVLVSDVAPLADLAERCNNFHCFRKGNAASLSEKLSELLESGDFLHSSPMNIDTFKWENSVQPVLRAMRSITANAAP